MGLLLDTHILLAIIEQRPEAFSSEMQRLLESSDEAFSVSVASLWEIAIKTRLGKLHLTTPLEDLPRLLKEMGIVVLAIETKHVLTSLDPEPPTRDPFDRLLLAQCLTEGMQLVTVDGALVGHPLAAKIL
jgi:PIN domain nuclease of toxin-antitoxin system